MEAYPTPAWLDDGDDAPGGPAPKTPGAGVGRTSAGAAGKIEKLLAGLTPSQREAVEHIGGPLLVLAGPGSGKTRVITRRIAHLIARGVPPWQILAVTFTNKAAGEMRERVGHLLAGGGVGNGPTICTFHSLCIRLLRRYVEASGLAEQGVLRPGFTVLDSDDQSKLIKSILAELQLSSSNFPPRSVQEAIGSAKNELLDAAEFAAGASDFVSKQQARVYLAYQAECRRANTVDFDDLLMLTARMLGQSEHVRQECQRRYQCILIDEYQDTNRAQLVIATLLAGGGQGAGGLAGGRTGPDICVVGDPDQSIYAWRGADITNILGFEGHYPGAKVIALGENFRSRAPIIAVADRLIRRNSQRKHKPLLSTRAGGEQVQVVLCRDEHHEARVVVDWLGARVREAQEGGRDVSWKDCAVFYRTNALSRVIEDAMRSSAIPYVMVRGTAFFQREEVRNAVAYLKAVANPQDRVSLERIINTPARGISDKTWDAVATDAAISGRSIAETLDAIEEVPGVSPRAAGAVRKFLVLLDGWRNPGGQGAESGLIEEPEPGLAQLVDMVLRESGLQGHYAKEEERAENLAELVSSAAEYEQKLLAGEYTLTDGEPPVQTAEGAKVPRISMLDRLAGYLERVALVADTDAINPRTGAVTLMTLHAAKGLEYPIVAMIGLEEGCLPHVRGMESPASLEEERRLCFVGITRAMDDLLLTSASFRTMRGMPERTIPSRFLDELAGPEVARSDQGYARAAGGGSFDDDESGDDQGVSLDDLDGQGHSHDDVPVYRHGERGPAQQAPFPAGCVVRHPQFGMGVVRAITPGANARVQVEFKHGGLKTLVLQYARLERIK